MPFYLEMSKNITKQRDIYDTVIFRFLQIFYDSRCLVIYIYIYIYSFNFQQFATSFFIQKYSLI